jgi:uncharacterized protein YbjT (DUF2867 family)
MQILVLGATGYVGSRVVPALLEAGHRVVAASSSPPAPRRFAWGDQVDWVQCDVGDEDAVRLALTDVDGICYLVHTLSSRGFADRDRHGAEVVRDVVAGSDVRRIVYLSGLVPDVAPEDLSEHISSRLEVEDVLEEAATTGRTVLALRAGVVLGAGSTSFEIIRQLATLLLVQPVPTWLQHKVQPIAVTDVSRAIVEAFGPPDSADPDSAGLAQLSGDIDIGGPDVLPYARLLAECSRSSGLLRVRVPAVLVPAPLVGLGTAALSAAPFWTVTALVASLRHDMVCRSGRTWVPADGEPLVGVSEAITRALAPDGGTPEAPLPSDPGWTRMRAPVLDEVHAPATVRAGASLALRRVRALLGRAD